jgi:hypothetical protein
MSNRVVVTARQAGNRSWAPYYKVYKFGLSTLFLGISKPFSTRSFKKSEKSLDFEKSRLRLRLNFNPGVYGQCKSSEFSCKASKLKKSADLGLILG